MASCQDFEKYLHEKFSFGEYQLLNKINDGFFSVVFKAMNKISRQNVVVKFLYLDYELDEAKKLARIASFEQECSIASMLSHPNIAGFLDKSPASDEIRYAVFEYIDGISLDEYLKLYGAPDVASAVVIMSQILNAMLYIHQCGVIHCDIKPSNIILSKKADRLHAVLLDFGISILSPELSRKGTSQCSPLSQERLGTPAYCSPEQLRGENVTQRSDLYMWGLVFLECLTGMPAIAGSHLTQLYHQHLNTLPVQIPAALLSHPLGYLLQKVLQKNAADRTANAVELFNELGQIATDDLADKFPVKILPHEDKPTIDLCQREGDR